jgi:hypothetical protein
MATSVLCLVLATQTVCGCRKDDRSPWDATVLSERDNPRNGLAGYGPMKAQVVEYHCTFIHTCTAVRFRNEVGDDDVFIYQGSPKELKTRWTGLQSFEIKCSDCESHRVRMKKPRWTT